MLDTPSTTDKTSTFQPTLALTQSIGVDGLFPVRPGTQPAVSAGLTAGMIVAFAGKFASFGAPCTAQSLDIGTYELLYSVIGTTFGGSDTSFQLPNLANVVPIGGVPGHAGSGTLDLTYMIAAEAFMPGQAGVPFIGTVGLFAGNYVPEGWLACNGQTVAAAQYPALAAVIGTTFGGSGGTIGLPDLNGAGMVGAGGNVALGQSVPGAIPGLGLNLIICIEGVMPSGPGGLDFEPEGVLGQVFAFAGTQIPQGWALCDGSLLPVIEYAALFFVLGTTYGGDGRTEFRLPDARGQLIVGTS